MNYWIESYTHRMERKEKEEEDYLLFYM